jgi:predicted amidophosphoribosyltransferase
MYSTTKIQIVEIIKKNEQIQVKELVHILGLTQAAIHRALNKLIEEKVITKKGTPPKVFYFLNEQHPSLAHPLVPEPQKKMLEENYLYINPVGKIETGLDGFIDWMQSTHNKQKPEKCIEEYLEMLREAQTHKNKNQLIDATTRFENIFKPSYLDKVFYHDFYSLIKFGKTKMGQYLLHGKQSQNKMMIKQIATMIEPDIKSLIRLEKIDAIAWTPHSIPRKVSFLKEIEQLLHINLPKIEITKVYAGKIPIAQKSLSKLDERIQNARETMIVVPSKIEARKVLLIDDAVGSGATLNEIAHKLKSKGSKAVVGYAMVGSYKGFEVIKEV